eukprot:CAMPEP_0201732876 /NCGR_PEP_ID=MMETSP0593-20130828/30052_1 /ASSEMBLY_ACC=CAM_ASM_000672 /TAXON_ID=267983 /ORGANISM="Skeletonema japonicum, Strain CCMP2506" /LENGTH=335 /DNA_ID=CAMNT_0048225923 /DNA_START=24 /DNA_END=1031 /DNA_ORIENTATION=+
MAFIHTFIAMLIFFGFFTCDTSDNMLPAVTHQQLLEGGEVRAAAANTNENMNALDRRMFKYFQSYFYVPPVPNNALRRDFPAKECGAAPAFDAFFGLKSDQRSRFNEDKWIYENVFLGKSNENMSNNVPGTYVEIGAFDGMHESNSRFFEVCLGWQGLLVEGQPRNYRAVLQNRQFAHKMSFAPSCDAEYEKVNKTVQFANYPLTNSGLKGYAKSYDAKPHVDVPCGPFTPVLEDIFAFSNKRINFFSLDVEGSEDLVLKTIDFSKVMIDVIMIEIQNHFCGAAKCEVREQVRQKMSSEGYLRYEKVIRNSDVYVHPKSIYQLPSTFKAANASIS